MANDAFLRQRLNDLQVAFAFLTRLPVARSDAIAPGDLSRALWAAPLVGVAVGAIGGAVYAFAQTLHVTSVMAATLAVAATILVTGALHEDGLADVADGFGGGATREQKLEIMRDSRIGSYGVLALILSLVLRIGALTDIGDSVLVAIALIAAHAGARTCLPLLMRLVPTARDDGLSAHAGLPPSATSLAAVLIGAAIILACLGLLSGLAALLLLAMAVAFMAWLCWRQIQGQTGDVLGALEQSAEVIVLVVAAGALTGLR